VRIVSSVSAAVRLDAARQFLGRLPPGREAVVLGASRGAADDLARAIARDARATFGLSRFSLTQFAARAAATRLAAAGRAVGTDAGAEAMSARAVFDATRAGDLSYFAPVAAMPGFPKALTRTLHELRLAGVSAQRLASAGPASVDIGRLLARLEDQLDRIGVGDRAALFRAGAEAISAGGVRWAGMPIVLLDVPLDSQAEREFVVALAAVCPDMLATMADGDAFARDALMAAGGVVEEWPDSAAASTDLASLRRHIFTSARPPARALAGDVRLFSAPGEGRESIEIVRRVLDEAARGVAFDEMAVFLRTPRQYLGLLDHACARGGVPVYFDRGTRRPDPAGRAFIALLSCAVEGLSARRFDEYLSLGQVPRAGAIEDDAEADSVSDPQIDSEDEAVIAGTLRAPWKWEELIVESAVVGGRSRIHGSARWRRRLDGLAADYRYRLEELQRDEPESPRILHFERDLRNLRHLRDFALPIIDDLAAWPDTATWGEWIERFEALAVRAVRRPARVLGALAELRPMADVGPVALDETCDVLRDRLATLDWEPPARRYGRLFVGTPHQARGRVFRVVFVPGLAERVVPQRPREDPLLLDAARRALPGMVRQDDRAGAERLLLKIALGAALERVYVSYPRLDVAETRARVPSFYALDVMRAMTGDVPDHRVLATQAAEEAGASLAWPAPKDPDRAIDDLEHDLATLKPLLDTRDPASVKGYAHYLLGLNESLRRSVISRWARARTVWSTSDGLIKVADGTRAALDANRLGRRPYSLSALQRFSQCPYQFLLGTIYRLEPWDEPQPLVRLDPLTRGSLFHRVQAEFYRALQASGSLPVTAGSLPGAVKTLDVVLEQVAADYEEQLAPAIDRVWRDEIGELRRDLGIWVQKLVDAGPWQPAYFEFSFGLGAGGARASSDDLRDPRSLPDPILIDGRFILRGSVDLIEHDTTRDVLRVTDHKTGKDRSKPGLIIDGGKVLQPVLYSVAVEQGLATRVVEGRLFFCTTAGGFAEQPIKIDDYSRGQGLQALTIIDRAVEQGFLPAAPAERACTWCDFRPVCGPREEERVGRKAADRLADLAALRSMR
jgi:ATP-dependent helicase/nuclease subunit B